MTITFQILMWKAILKLRNNYKGSKTLTAPKQNAKFVHTKMFVAVAVAAG